MGKYLVRRLLWMVVVLFFVSLHHLPARLRRARRPRQGHRRHARHAGGPGAHPPRPRPRQAASTTQYGLYLWHLLHGNIGYSLPDPAAGHDGHPAALPGDGHDRPLRHLLRAAHRHPDRHDLSALKQYSVRTARSRCSACSVLSAPGVLARPDPAVLLRLQDARSSRWAATTAGCTPSTASCPASRSGIGGAAWYSRMLRRSMLDILNADYVRAARAKGLPERTVVWRHIMRNAWSPDRHAAGHGLRLVPRRRARHRDRLRRARASAGRPGTPSRRSDMPHDHGHGRVRRAAGRRSNLVVDIAYTWLDPRVKYS